MTQWIQILILGLVLGGVYALMATGLTLIFGVMRIINLAHAAFIILAAYLAYGAFQAFNLDPILSMVITMPAMFLLGIVLYRILFPRIVDSPRYVEMTVLLSFALALISEGLMSYAFTGIYRSSTPAYATQAFLIGPFYLPRGQFYGAVISVGLLVALWAVLQYTRIGHAIRATMQNRDAAQIVGVDVNRISMLSFGIGMALAGASGSLMSYLFTFFPGKHWQWIAILMSLIVLGGLGSLLGAFVGAVLLAVAAAFVSNYFGPTWSPMTFFLALFLILIIRPQGLFGKKLEV